MDLMVAAKLSGRQAGGVRFMKLVVLIYKSGHGCGIRTAFK
jgi:hypothetical protein